MDNTQLLANSENIFMPHEAVIKDIIVENSMIRTYVLEFADETFNHEFSHEPGQFLMLSVPHQGEAPISISSSPATQGAIHLSVRKAGRLTSALHNMKTGESVGLRGPYGRPFPMQDLKGRDLLFIAGGIGLAPLCSVISFCLDSHGDYGHITLLYGSRNPSDIAFRRYLDQWSLLSSMTCLLTVDIPEPGWDGHVGLVTTLLDQVDMDIRNSSALLCGPPVMIDAVSHDLLGMGFKAGDIITTMERNMKCGVGLCGHCHMNGKMVCKHGPVFSVEELQEINGAVS